MEDGCVGGGEGPTPRVMAAVSHVLDRLVARNERISLDVPAMSKNFAGDQKSTGLEGFCGSRVPSIGIGRYMERIHQFTGCSPACFVVGFAYIDRAAHRRPGSMLLSINMHRLVLTSILIASKILDDMHQNNAFYAKVGGVSNLELNRLELELLFLLDFDVTLSLRVFESYCLHLEKEMMWSGNGSQKIERPIPSVNGEFEQPMDGTQDIATQPLSIY